MREPRHLIVCPISGSEAARAKEVSKITSENDHYKFVQHGVIIPGTPRLNRKSRSLIALVRIWTNSELLALLRPLCLLSVLSRKIVSFWWSRSSAGLVVARPFRSLNHFPSNPMKS